MRLTSLKNLDLRVMLQRATVIAVGSIIVTAAWAEASLDDRVDWVMDRQAEFNGELSVSLDTESADLFYGDVVNATVDVANGTNEDRHVVIKVLLGEVAQFVRGDHGVKFAHPDRAEHQRLLEWPALFLPPGSRGRVSFQFLVSWNASADYVYIQADAIDPTKGNPPVVTHLRETPQYPAGGGGFLERYGYALVTAVLGIALIFGVWRAQCRFVGGESFASSLSGVCMGVGAVFIVLFASVIWSEFGSWLGSWKETKCTILDVRYALRTRQMRVSSQGESSTIRSYSGILTLGFEGPEGPVVTSGYRHQSSIRSPEIMNKYRAGSEAVCYYDPKFPDRVIIERDLNISSILKASAHLAVGLFLVWFGNRSSSRAKSSRQSDLL